MNANAELVEIYGEACADNIDALAFLWAFHRYAHKVDDLIDERFTPERLLSALSLATTMYSTPFWIENSARLSGAMQVVGNTYADSVAWERSGEKWKAEVADVIRLVGNDMVIVVAQIVGGWEHGRRISQRLREFAWRYQHKET
jgi:alpha-D-ribose 1-methylphosphonate 5-triphosphate diphosphatase PhnM